MKENEILKIAKRIQSIAQAGLQFTENSFDIDRYNELRELSVKLVAEVVDAPINKIRDLFTYEHGFQTPKVDIRSVVLKDNQILLTHEKSDNCWSLPGGFADVNYSPKEVAEKEVFEETGLIVKAQRLLAVIDSNKYNFPPLEFHYYKLVFLCKLEGGVLKASSETHGSDFFDFDDLPELSLKRNTYEMMSLIKHKINDIEPHID
jgi:ADP-ribose pyrophosphatase YjhB (NUDIX family)